MGRLLVDGASVERGKGVVSVYAGGGSAVRIVVRFGAGCYGAMVRIGLTLDQLPHALSHRLGPLPKAKMIHHLRTGWMTSDGPVCWNSGPVPEHTASSSPIVNPLNRTIHATNKMIRPTTLRLLPASRALARPSARFVSSTVRVRPAIRQPSPTSPSRQVRHYADAPASGGGGSSTQMWVILAAILGIGAGGYFYLKPVRDVAANANQVLEGAKSGAQGMVRASLHPRFKCC